MLGCELCAGRQVSNQVKPQEEALGPQINSLRPSSARWTETPASPE